MGSEARAAHAGNGVNRLAALSPVPVLSGPEPDSELVTELVAGETLVALEESGDYLRVVVPGHPSSLDERGYPGWVPRDAALVSADGWSPDRIVSGPNRAGLPLGARLRTTDKGPAPPRGEVVDLDPGDTILAGTPIQTSATGLARSLIGLPYRWGGTDSTTGMDCSGLVFRVMQALGITVARDSGDQLDRAPFKSPESQLDRDAPRPGDLVFFGEEAITHVGFYIGDGEYISAHGGDRTGCVTVRAVTDDYYRGFARY